jgi:hypothetical protein
MKRLFGAAAIAAIGVVVGAGGMHVPQAQTKPRAYFVGVIDLKDADAYKNLAGDVRKRIQEKGAKLLVAVIWEYPSLDAYKAWWAEVGEKDANALHQHATLRLYAAEGVSK